MQLKDLGEGALIRRIRDRFKAGGAVLGIGDDAAVFDIPDGHSAVFCADLVAEGSHFLRNLHPPDSVGYKAVAVNVSDVGAMGGIPMHFVISLAAPGDLSADWVDGFYAGVEQACRDFEVTLVGGDTSSAPSIFVDVAMIGRVARGKAITRSGAQVGDKIYLTGKLGASARGFNLLKAGSTDAPALERHLYPKPRHVVGRAVANRAHAMIDVSDGLSTDLGHIAEESGVSARIHRIKLPGAVGASDAEILHGGEEYELLIVAPELPTVVEGVPLTCIGEIVASGETHQVLLVHNNVELPLRAKGWDHYAQ